MPDIVSPIDGQVAFSFTQLTFDAALARLSRAEGAAAIWRMRPLATRVALCRRMLETFRAQLDANAIEITRMMGKPIAQARAEFEGGMCERTLSLCDVAAAALADHVVSGPPGSRRFIRHEPVGVVLDIAAWNYPLLIAVNVIVPAVLAGNAVLVKHASQTALVAEQFERAFAEAGAPEGLVQAFSASHATVADVIASRRIGYVSFTGSVASGHTVAQTVARENFIGLGLELGGKDPAVVLPDCDFEATVDGLVDGAFYNAGQSCCGVERIYVHRAIFERFSEAYAEKVRSLKMGDPMDGRTALGPVADARAARHVRDQVEAAQAQGARSIVGSEAFDVPDRSPCYLAPAVLDRVDHSMAIMREETFGPAVGIMAFDNEDEAISLANDSRYGLTASVWSSDPDRGEQLATRLAAGTVYLNRCDYLDPALAWTGIKDSGFGCSLSELGFRSVTRPKSFNLRIGGGVSDG